MSMMEGGRTIESQTIKRFSIRELDEKRAKGICYKCGNKWSRGHQCPKNKLFIIEDHGEEEEDFIEDDDEECPTISMYSLAGIPTPQTLNIEGFIKDERVMLANGGTITYGGKCQNITITMGEYNVSIMMYSIPMGGVDVFLGAQWM
eukprot:Gb_35871 [translate_table: standard]